MIRTIGYSERNVYPDPPRIVNAPALTAVEIFPNDHGTKGEICTRYLQNAGDNRLYLSFNLSQANGDPQCNNIDQFHAFVEAGQLFDCSPFRSRVCGYSVAGTSVATTLVRRYDFAHSQNPLP